jgi:Tfp pilus assembly protein PilN
VQALVTLPEAAPSRQQELLAQTLAELKRITSENDLLKQEIDKIITDRNGQRRTVISLTDELNTLNPLVFHAGPGKPLSGNTWVAPSSVPKKPAADAK